MNLAGELCGSTVCERLDSLGTMVVMIAGIGMFVAFGMMSYREGRHHLGLARSGYRVPGRVVGVAREYRGSSGGRLSRGRGEWSVVPAVRYVTLDGESVVSAPRWVQRQPARRPLPTEVTVIYDPGEPRRMMIEHPGYVSDPMTIALAALVGVAVSALGVFLLVLCLGCQLVR